MVHRNYQLLEHPISIELKQQLLIK